MIRGNEIINDAVRESMKDIVGYIWRGTPTLISNTNDRVYMRQTIANLALIIAVGAILYYTLANAYTEGTANIVGLGYFLLTIRLLDLLETIEEALTKSAPALD